jgi:hypothetical protein
MAPPPGYAGYQPTNWAGGLKRVRGLATAAVVLSVAAAIASVVSLATVGTGRDAARDYLAGRINTDDFNDEVLASSFGQLLTGTVSIALAVVSIIWLYRIVSNHRNLGRSGSWSPGWAIGGWFLPPCLFVIPFLIVRESFKASDPASPPGTETWRTGAENPLPWIWIGLFGVAQLALGIASGFSSFSGFGADEDELADNILDTSTGITVAQALVGVAAAVVWALLVRTLTARHTQLTGEAAAR